MKLRLYSSHQARYIYSMTTTNHLHPNKSKSRRHTSTYSHTEPGSGASPVVVFHAEPAGTCQSPRHAQFQSVLPIISRWASTKVDTAHLPSLSSGHPRMPVRGATPSLMMTRICCSGRFSQDNTTGRRQLLLGETGTRGKKNTYAGIGCSSRKARGART